MSRISTAVKEAITELNEKDDISLDEIVELAEEKLGDGAELHMRELLHAALKRKAGEMVRSFQNNSADDRQLELLGALSKKRCALRQRNGEFIYRKFLNMSWSDLVSVHEKKKNHVHHAQEEIGSFKSKMDQLAPVMENSPNVTVEEAIRILHQEPEAAQ